MSNQAGVKRISSLELAKLCNVSQATVDRALHGRGRIAEVTRERILAAAKQYGYVAHPAARELLTGVSPFVAAIVPSVNGVFFADIMESLRASLAHTSLQLIVAPRVTTQHALELVQEFSARRMAGIVIVSPDENLFIDESIVRAQPVVSLVNPCSTQGVGFIGPNEEETGYQAVMHLYAHGHSRITHFSYPDRTWAVMAREKGYTRAMEEIGAKPVIMYNAEESFLLETLKKYAPTALFCHNDPLALLLIRLLLKNGISVPGQISVMGVDGSPTFNAIYPGLSTMHYPYQEIADAVTGCINGSLQSTNAIKCTVLSGETVADIR